MKFLYIQLFVLFITACCTAEDNIPALSPDALSVKLLSDNLTDSQKILLIDKFSQLQLKIDINNARILCNKINNVKEPVAINLIPLLIESDLPRNELKNAILSVIQNSRNSKTIIQLLNFLKEIIPLGEEGLEELSNIYLKAIITSPDVFTILLDDDYKFLCILTYYAPYNYTDYICKRIKDETSQEQSNKLLLFVLSDDNIIKYSITTENNLELLINSIFKNQDSSSKVELLVSQITHRQIDENDLSSWWNKNKNKVKIISNALSTLNNPNLSKEERCFASKQILITAICNPSLLPTDYYRFYTQSLLNDNEDIAIRENYLSSLLEISQKNYSVAKEIVEILKSLIENSKFKNTILSKVDVSNCMGDHVPMVKDIIRNKNESPLTRGLAAYSLRNTINDKKEISSIIIGFLKDEQKKSKTLQQPTNLAIMALMKITNKNIDVNDPKYDDISFWVKTVTEMSTEPVLDDKKDTPVLPTK